MRLVFLVLFALPAIAAPDGFHVSVYARGLEQARMVLALDDGTVLVSRPKLNDVVALRDRNGDGRADEMLTVISSLDKAHGLAMRGDTLYVAGVKKIVASERMPDGTFAPPHDVVSDLPDGGQHPNRTIGFGPDGKLYVSIGSSCNDCTESEPEHATLLQMDPDGGNRRIYARGLRSMLGFDWHPETHELWGADGDELSRTELNRIGDSLNYGWPFCLGNQLVDASLPDPDGTTKAKFCSGSEPPALELPPNTAPIGFVFYRGGDAFSTWRGSLVRVRYRNGKPIAFEELFKDNGRLAGVTVAKDGTLFFSDDQNGIVYRAAYGKGMPEPMTSSGGEDLKPVLAKAFHLGDLRTPESVLHDEEQDVYLVSNIDGPSTAKDGNGFIARITPEGKVDKLKFIEGLDAPKGMALRGDELWVADIDKVRVFDRVSGKPLRTIDLASQGAVFLNDVATGGDDAIYVTDSDIRIKGKKERVRAGNGRVYRIGSNGKAEVAAEGEELHSPNGITWDGLRFLIAESYGHDILAWTPGSVPKAVMRGPGAYDGIVVLPNGTVIVSSHHDDGLHVAHGTGELQTLFAAKPTPADIGFDRKRNRLLIPSLEGDWLEAWTLPPMEREKSASRERKELAANTSPRFVPSPAESRGTSSTTP